MVPSFCTWIVPPAATSRGSGAISNSARDAWAELAGPEPTASESSSAANQNNSAKTESASARNPAVAPAASMKVDCGAGLVAAVVSSLGASGMLPPGSGVLFPRVHHHRVERKGPSAPAFGTKVLIRSRTFASGPDGGARSWWRDGARPQPPRGARRRGVPPAARDSVLRAGRDHEWRAAGDPAGELPPRRPPHPLPHGSGHQARRRHPQRCRRLRGRPHRPHRAHRLERARRRHRAWTSRTSSSR